MADIGKDLEEGIIGPAPRRVERAPAEPEYTPDPIDVPVWDPDPEPVPKNPKREKVPV